MTPERLAEIREGVESCQASHAHEQYPFCEQYGCMSMRELLAEIDRLKSGEVRSLMDGVRLGVRATLATVAKP